MLCSSTATVLGSRSERRDFMIVRSFAISRSYTGCISFMTPSARARLAFGAALLGVVRRVEATEAGVLAEERCAPGCAVVDALPMSPDCGTGGLMTATSRGVVDTDSGAVATCATGAVLEATAAPSNCARVTE